MTKARLQELFTTEGALMVCIGSWKAYAEGGPHCYGSEYNGHYYINYELLDDGAELLDLLKTIGWSDAECEELFIQDYQAVGLELENTDYINPVTLLKAFTENNILINENNIRKVGAYVEAVGSIWEALENFQNYDYYDGISGATYMEEYMADCFDIFSKLDNYWFAPYVDIDYEEMARDADYLYETNDGVLVMF